MPTTLILHVTEPLNEWDVSKILLWSILCLGVKITNIFSFLNNIRSWYSYRNCLGKTDFNLKNKIPLQNYKKQDWNTFSLQAWAKIFNPYIPKIIIPVIWLSVYVLQKSVWLWKPKHIYLYTDEDKNLEKSKKLLIQVWH